MKLRQLFENPDAQPGMTVGVCFGRWNPPHKGHRAAWETAAQFDEYFIGTNRNTQGPNDPLPYDVKLAAMKTIWPGVAKHVIPEQNLFTLCTRIYEKYGESVDLKVCTDEDWLTNALEKYNGQEGNHGFYKFASISQEPTPRLSSATALRTAVRQGDKELFSAAAGVPWDTHIVVGGVKKRFFDIVAHYLKEFPEKAKKAKKELAEIAGAFPSPSTRKYWADQAALSNAAEAQRQAQAAASANAERLKKNTEIVDKEQKTNYHALDKEAVPFVPKTNEGVMSELHAEIADHLSRPLQAFKNKRIDPETMGEKCVKLARLLAKKHNTDYHTMQELVNNYIDNELEGEDDDNLLEAKPTGKLKKSQINQSGRAMIMRDVGGYDRIYHMHRVMMAMAMADGRTGKPVKMDASSWYEKYNTAHPFSDADYLKIQSAIGTVPSDVKELIKDKRSLEVPGTNVTSPVAKPKKNKYGV